MSEVRWRDHTIPVRNEKVRLFLLSEQELSESLNRAADQQTKITLIENLLMDCKDAIAVVKEELKGDAVILYFNFNCNVVCMRKNTNKKLVFSEINIF